MKPLENALYVAASLDIPKEQVRRYKAYVAEILQPFYQQQKGNTLTSASVYFHRMAAEKHGSFHPWNILQLVQLTDPRKIAEYLEGVNALESYPKATVIRHEILATTPNSNYLEPSVKRWLKPMTAVEYVDVQEPYLGEFRNIMIRNNGPAMRYIMEERRWCHSFIALETTDVLYHNPNNPAWNQLHIVALYPEAPLLYKRDFSQGLSAASGDSFEDNFARLHTIRTMLYKTISKKLV